MGIYYTQRMAVQGGEMLVHYVGRPVHRAVRQPDEAELSDWALATVLDHLPIDAVLAGFDSALLHLGMINIRLRTPPPRIINIRLLRTPPPRNDKYSTPPRSTTSQSAAGAAYTRGYRC